MSGNGSAEGAELVGHDLLCDSNGFGPPAECDDCDLIALARADEREKAAQRVWAAAKKANGAWATPILSLEAVAAARGETS